MKKKFLSGLMALAIAIPCAFGLVGCGEDPADPTTPPATHTHSYAVCDEYLVVEDKAYHATKKCDCGDYEKTELADYIIATPETAQEILDGEINDKTVVLSSGEYGKLYLRKNDASTLVESADWAGGNNTYYREVENVTILGAEGTEVDAIVAEAGTYAHDGNTHSQAAEYQYLQTLMSFENFTVKNITFTLESDDVAVDIARDGLWVSIDGLIIDDCVLEGEGTADAGDRLFYSAPREVEIYETDAGVVLTCNRKNITIKNCDMKNLHQGVKIMYVENLTIENNTFTGIKGRDLLIGADLTALAGEIKITGNTFDGSTERVIRMTNVDAEVEISNNVVKNYDGEDDDMVKIDLVSDAEQVTLSGNDWNGVNDEDALDEVVKVVEA